jgi:8-oxo-dGTP diphosphatase
MNPSTKPQRQAASLWVKPDLNYCTVCGSSLENRYAFGRERRYCPHCQRVVFREHKVAAATLITGDGGSVLLVQRALSPYQGCWSLPAGFVDVDETPAAAAARECLEETGLEIEITHLLEVIGGREHNGGADIVIVYRGARTGGILAPGDDASDAKFFPLNQLPTLAFTSTHRTLKRWRCERNEENS